MRRLTVPRRPDWEAKAKAYGFHFTHMYGQLYWDESACFAFTLDEIERDIEDPSTELHAMCLELADEASRDEGILDQLGIPEAFRDYVAESWRRRDPTIFGRFDLAYRGEGPAKLLEYNADTPTSLYETAFFQWLWMQDAKDLGIISPDCDQFNSIQERLIAAYDRLPKRSILHFAGYGGDVEDTGTLSYMMDCASQGGHAVKFIDITQIGCDAADRFTDTDDLVIDVLSNLYPWEWFFEDEFGPKIPSSGTRMIEPAWKAMLSTKAILPLLWGRHRGHPNLLEAYFEDDPRSSSLMNYVRKPLFSREGSNITLHRSGIDLMASDGPYGEGGWIRQSATDLFQSPEGGYAVIGSWIVDDTACGIGIREDSSPITMNLSRFVPHIIAD
ncbi:glutathionylspermidine synthase family protein [Microvirga mediterraneensis]|uniref:Glutathionylspermidine synthase family protein n=1 Tax=Microvirga mediterraneensis TaxID=2754695 RepID=A0A838BR68_9HYPH|nr:glutathionylspermidine synthase family protein [Microvirga mediterraneensis]MBA1157881.1 glutathionylspermidine synthase family protein [Microvirga mediterraneensis]